MTIEQMIQEYVDGSLSSKATDELFQVLASSPELRRILDDELWLMRSFTNSSTIIAPPSHLENRIQTSISARQPRPVLERLFVVITALFSVLVSLIALIVELETSHGHRAIRSSGTTDETRPTLNATKSLIETDSPLPFDRAPKGNWAPSVEFASSSSEIDTGLRQIDLRPLMLPESSINSDLFPSSRERFASLARELDIDSFELTDNHREGIPLEISVRLLAQQFNLPRQSLLLPSPGTAYALRCSFAASEQLRIGIEAGREQFLQNYTAAIPGTSTTVNVTQLGNVWWVGANGQYIPFPPVGPFQPSLGATLGWSNVGPMARLQAAVNISHGSFVYTTGIEYALSTYRDGRAIKIPSNLALTIGIGIAP